MNEPSELYEFRLEVLLTKLDYADDNADIFQARRITKEIDQLENAHKTQSLKYVGSLVIEHCIEFQAPKSKLLIRTINNAKPNRVKTVATGWLLHLNESNRSDSESGTPGYIGYLLNQSNDLFRFENGELLAENKVSNYRVSRYGRATISAGGMSIPYPDLEDDIIGRLDKLEYGDASRHEEIESLFIETVIKNNIKI